MTDPERDLVEDITELEAKCDRLRAELSEADAVRIYEVTACQNLTAKILRQRDETRAERDELRQRLTNAMRPCDVCGKVGGDCCERGPTKDDIINEARAPLRDTGDDERWKCARCGHIQDDQAQCAACKIEAAAMVPASHPVARDTGDSDLATRSRPLPKTTPDKSLMHNDDKYQKFIRSLMRSVAEYALGSAQAAPRGVDWLAVFMLEQQFSAREEAFKEACLTLCPECPGDDHEDCAATPVRELHAEDLRLREVIQYAFPEVTQPGDIDRRES